MKLKHCSVVLLLVASFGLVGCGLDRDDLVGTWNQSVNSDAEANSVTDQIAQSFTEFSDSSLELRDDGTATYNTLGIGLEGDWEFDKEERTVTLTDSSGRISLKFEVSEDGKKLSKSGDDSLVFFEKADD